MVSGVSGMRREMTMRAAALLGAAALLVLAGSAQALEASFDPTFGFLADDLSGLPQLTIDEEDPFLMAGEGGVAGLDVELTGSEDICILFGSETCRASTTGITGPYSVLVSIEVTDVSSDLEGLFTLFLSDVDTTYSRDDVKIDLDPIAPSNLDTRAVPGFVWNGGFTPFVAVMDETFSPTVYNYVGWTVQLGSVVTFKYDVLRAPAAGQGTPGLFANATPRIVPEPGTALLMGLGLAGLASVGRRGASGRA